MRQAVARARVLHEVPVMRQAVDYRHEQVARAVARGCDVGGGVEVIEEHGREARAMRGAVGVREV